MVDYYRVYNEDCRLKIELNPRKIDEAIGREVLNGFCRCFVHTDRLTSAISWAETSRKYHGTGSVPHQRDISAMVWFSIGTLRELSRAIFDLRKALVDSKLVDFKDKTWMQLSDFEKRWREGPYKNMRNLGAFHVDENIINKGLDELVKEESVTLADVDRRNVNSRLWLGYLALLNGLELNRETYGELLDLVMADHAFVIEAIPHAFILATKAAGVPSPEAELKIYPNSPRRPRTKRSLLSRLQNFVSRFRSSIACCRSH